MTNRTKKSRKCYNLFQSYVTANSAQNSQLGCSEKKEQIISKKLKLIYAFVFITMTPPLLEQNAITHD